MRNSSFAAALVLSTVVAAALAGCDSSDATAVSSAADPAQAVDTTVAQATAASAGKPRPKLLPGARTTVLSRAGDRDYDKTFDDLRFDIAVGAPFERKMLPEAINSLEGQHIRIRGFILPTAQKRGLKTFVLVRDNQECCFGPGAALFDCILVEMQPDKTAEFSIRPVAVAGTFNIREILGPDGKHLAIYQMDGEAVE